MPAAFDLPLPPLYALEQDTFTFADLTRRWKDVLAEGVINKTGNEAKVAQHAGGAAMSVDVAAAPSGALIQGDDDAFAQGLYRIRWTAAQTLAISANASGSTRIDRIVVRVYDSQYAGAANKATLEVIEGVPGAGAPANPNGAHCLATVSVASGAATIVDANITDTRAAYALAATLPQTVQNLTVVADTTLGADTASFDIQNIAAAAVLEAFLFLRSDRAATTDDLLVRFNNDSGANYDKEGTKNENAVTSVESFGQTSLSVSNGIPANSASANLFSIGRLVVAHFANALNNKAATLDSFSKWGTSAANMNRTSEGGAWRSNNAITRVTFLPATGTAFKSGSRCSVYTR